VSSIRDSSLAISCAICSFWPYKLVTQLLARLVAKAAVNVQTSTPVLSVSQAPNGDSILHTPRGNLQATKLIFATNGYTGGICPTFANHIVPTTATAVHITPTAGPVHPHLSHTYNITYQPGHTDYLNPRPDGGIVVGGGQWTYQHDRSRWYNKWDDSIQLSETNAHFDGLMQRHFLGWENSGAKTDFAWTGIQGVTADGLPFIGSVPGKESRQWILAGYNGGGNGLVFLCAKGVADMVVNGTEFRNTGVPATMESRAERLEGAGNSDCP
jgi:glycine/D-amino acid oxidase-like deaminating enzyme